MPTLILRRALDLDFGVDVDVEDPALFRLLEQALAGLPAARTTPSARYRVTAGADGLSLAWGAETLRTTASRHEVLDALVGHLNLASIAASRGQLLLHAGAAALPDGRVIVLPAPSGSGKTTLTAELVGTGLAYLTDETLGVDPVNLSVTPYRKPLTVKPGSFSVLGHLAPEGVGADAALWQVPVARLGGRNLPEAPLRVALVVAPEYAGGVSTELLSISAAEAVFRLGTNSSSLSAVRPRPLGSLARLVEGVPTYRLPYSDVAQARDLVLSALGGTA